MRVALGDGPEGSKWLRFAKSIDTKNSRTLCRHSSKTSVQLFLQTRCLRSTTPQPLRLNWATPSRRKFPLRVANSEELHS